jgi:hypothetical protein
MNATVIDQIGDNIDQQQAPSVILLHGWPGASSDFRLVIPELVKTARVVVPDLKRIRRILFWTTRRTRGDCRLARGSID